MIDDRVTAAYNHAPKAIQESLSEGKALDFIMDAQQRFHLRVDAAGALADAVRDTLIGLLPPTELQSTLIKGGIDETTAQALIPALNTEVFMPLRDEMRKAGAAAAAPQAPAAPSTPAPAAPKAPLVPPPSLTPPIQAPAPSPIPSSPAAPLPPKPSLPEHVPSPASMPVSMQAAHPAQPQESQVHSPVPPAPRVEVPAVPISRPAPPPPPVLPGQEPIVDRPSFVPPPPSPVIPAPSPAANDPARIVHTMARDMRAVKDGVDPYRVAHPEPPAWAVLEKPTSGPQPTSSPIYVPKPGADRPEHTNPQPVPEANPMPPANPQIAMPPRNPIPPPPTPTSTAIRASAGSYATDPYREPIE